MAARSELIERLEAIHPAKAPDGKVRLLARIERLRTLIDYRVVAELGDAAVSRYSRLVKALYDAEYVKRYGDEWLDVKQADATVAKVLARLTAAADAPPSRTTDEEEKLPLCPMDQTPRTADACYGCGHWKGECTWSEMCPHGNVAAGGSDYVCVACLTQSGGK